MKITYAPKKQPQLTLKDLKPGDVFTFEDEVLEGGAKLMLCGDRYIHLNGSSAFFSHDAIPFQGGPVRLLDDELFIYEEE